MKGSYVMQSSSVGRLTGQALIKHLKTSIYTQNLEEGQISLALCDKINESGYSSNTRLLVLHSSGWIAYCREISPKTVLPIMRESQLPEYKTKIILQHIKLIEIVNSLTLKLTFYDTEQSDNKIWQFKMSSPHLASIWQNKIMDIKAQMMEQQTRKPINSGTVLRRQSQLRISSTLNEHMQFSVSREVENKPIAKQTARQNKEQQITKERRQQVPIPKDKSHQHNLNQNDHFNFNPPSHPNHSNMHSTTQYQFEQPPKQFMQISAVTNISYAPAANDHRQQLEQLWVFPEYKGRKDTPPKTVKSSSSSNIHMSFQQKSQEEQYNIESAVDRQWLPQDISQFQHFSSAIIRKIVDQMMLPLNQQVFRPRVKMHDMHIYQLPTVTIKIAFTMMQGTAYNYQAKYKLKKQFKNYVYRSREHKTYPVCKVEYKGVYGLVTANQNINQPLKLPQNSEHQQYHENILKFTDKEHDIDQILLKKAEELASKWDRQPEIVMTSRDLTKLLHSFGLNTQHLSIVYEFVQTKSIKKIIMSEIGARCVKIILAGRINENNGIMLVRRQIEERSQETIRQIIELLKTILTEDSKTSRSILQQISTLSIEQFNKTFDKSMLCYPYFYHALLTHSLLEINWKAVSRDILIKNNIFKGLAIKSKCLPDHKNMKNLEEMIRNNQNEQIKLLIFRRQPWLKYVNQQDIYQHFTKTNQVIKMHSYLDGYLSTNHLIKIKDKKGLQKALESVQQHHPIRWRILEQQYQAAIKADNYSEALIKAKNLLLLKTTYEALTQNIYHSYFSIAEALRKLRRFKESKSYLGKVKQIYKLSDKLQIQYCISMVGIEIAEGKYNEACTLLSDYFQQILGDRKNSQFYVQFLQKAHEITRQLKAQYQQVMKEMVEMYAVRVDNVDILKKLINIHLRVDMSQMEQETLKEFKKLMQEMEKQSQKIKQKEHLRVLKKRIKEDSLWPNWREYTKNIGKMMGYINRVGVLSVWSGQPQSNNNFQDFLTICMHFVGSLGISSIL